MIPNGHDSLLLRGRGLVNVISLGGLLKVFGGVSGLRGFPTGWNLSVSEETAAQHLGMSLGCRQWKRSSEKHRLARFKIQREHMVNLEALHGKSI